MRPSIPQPPVLACVSGWTPSPARGAPAAAFDTRAGAAPAMLTGRASKGIARGLHRRGFEQVVQPESFLVDKENHLEPGEEQRAEGWGARLAATVGPEGRSPS